MMVAALVGGLLGASCSVFAYFLGIALVGAGLGALIAHVAWTPVRQRRAAGAADRLLLAVAGTVAAMFLQRYVIIVSTAFRRRVDDHARRTGAGRSIARRERATDVWILYPSSRRPGAMGGSLLVWVALGIAGTARQTGGDRGTKKVGRTFRSADGNMQSEIFRLHWRRKERWRLSNGKLKSTGRVR